MSYRLAAFAAALAVLVALVLWSGTPHGINMPGAGGVLPPDPGFAAHDARLIQTGDDGKPLYTLQAATIRQSPAADRVDLDGVQLAFRDADGGTWTARAAHGELAQESGRVQLDGDVHVDGALPGSDAPAGFLSEHLDFDTGAQRVTTRDPVTFVSAGHELHATGMVARLKEHRVQLESAVHGSFAP